LCPPAIYIPEVSRLLGDSSVALGAQNVSDQESGAFTGEISVTMLADYNCRYVIVGHSERRHIYGESDEFVARKFARAVAGGLTPILCVGELLEERESGSTEEVVARQLDAAIQVAGMDAFARAVIAYEPVWAIGTGRNATPEQAQEVHAFIRLRLARNDDDIADRIRILYGGSVKADNAKQIFSMVDVDGGLIGGASLKGQDFVSICRATE
jgi:triosephosphate isomerase